MNPLIQTFGRRRNRNLSILSLQSLQDYHILNHISYLNKYASIVLEIGFGYGEYLLNEACAYPDTLFIGAETYWNGIAKLLENIKVQYIKNILIWPDDVRLLFPYLTPQSLQKIFILFPDPWPKKKHHKRRLISINFLNSLIPFLKEGASISLVTDHVEYAEWIKNILRQVTNITFTYTFSEKLLLNLPTRYQIKAKNNFYYFTLTKKYN